MIVFTSQYALAFRRSRVLICNEGVKYHALLSFLHYLYTDHLKVASHNVERLMHLARYPGVSPLKPSGFTLRRLFHIPRLHALCKRVYVTEEGTPLEPIPPSTFSGDPHFSVRWSHKRV